MYSYIYGIATKCASWIEATLANIYVGFIDNIFFFKIGDKFDWKQMQDEQ